METTILKDKPMKLLLMKWVWSDGIEQPWLQRCAEFYTLLLEETISPRTALRILHFQLAVLLLLLPISLPVFWHVLLGVWAVQAGRGAWRSWKAQPKCKTSPPTQTNSSPSRT